MRIEDVSPELREKLREKLSECENTSDIVKLAAENGIMLTDEQLDAVSDGNFWDACMCDYMKSIYGDDVFD